MRRNREQRRRPILPAIVTWLGLSIVVHVVLIGVLTPLWPHLQPDSPALRTTPVTLLVEMPEEPEPPEPEEEDEPDLSGQIVDTPPPKEEERPEDYEYLAEHDRTVEEETRSERFRINPEVLSEEYSDDDQVQFEEAFDLNVTEPSTGAQVGNDRFDPDRDGRLAAVPSPFAVSNKDGLQKPVPASSANASVAGAPNNDLLDEKRGDAVRLNTRELIGATYINRIRRLVNFYWDQNLDNLPRSVRFSRPSYTTVVVVVLDGNGSLESLEVVSQSGSDPLDNAVVQAFRIAGPFPNPPEQLVSKDGRVYLPDMGFVVSMGQARAPYMGVDPRAGVQFPGILKSPR